MFVSILGTTLTHRLTAIHCTKVVAVGLKKIETEINKGLGMKPVCTPLKGIQAFMNALRQPLRLAPCYRLLTHPPETRPPKVRVLRLRRPKTPRE